MAQQLGNDALARQRAEAAQFARIVHAAVRIQAAYRGWASRRYADRVNELACAQWIEWHLSCNQFDEARLLGWDGNTEAETAVRERNRVRARAALRIAVQLQAMARRWQGRY